MKNARVLTAAALVIAILSFTLAPAASVSAADAGGYYQAANTGDSRDSTSGFSGTEASLFGSALYYQSDSKQNNISFYFDDLTAPAGTKYFVFWFGQEYVKNANAADDAVTEDYYLNQRFSIYYRDGAEEGSFSDYSNYAGKGGLNSAVGVTDNIYAVSTDDGVARSISMNGHCMTGSVTESSNWGTFKNGYYIVPVSLISGAEDYFAEERVIDFRIQLSDSSIYFNSEGETLKDNNVNYSGLSPNTRVYIDNVGFITDKEAFLADIGASTSTEKGRTVYANASASYKMGWLADGSLSASAVVDGGVLHSSWNEVGGADSYLVNIYDGSGALIHSESTAELSYSSADYTDPSYSLQVLAMNSGSIAAVSGLKSLGRPGYYYEIVNSGESTENVSGEAVGVTAVSNTPDGAGIRARTVINKDGLATDQTFARVLFKNVKVPENAEAVVFWFGQDFEMRREDSVMTDPTCELLPIFKVTWSPAGTESYTSTSAGRTNVYQISTDDGKVYSQSFDQPFTGTPSQNSNWCTFRNGYVIIPVSLFASEGFGTDSVNIRITVEGGSKYIDSEGNVFSASGLISANTVMYFDNLGFITDMTAFTEDCGSANTGTSNGKTTYTGSTAAYKMGYMNQSGALEASAEYHKNSVSIDWNAVDGAESYDVTVYSGSSAVITESFTEASAVFGGLPDNSYGVQVIARNADGEIIAVSARTEAFKAGQPGDVNDDYSVDIRDLVAMKKLLAAGDPEYIETGDINGDGFFDARDLTAFRKLLLEV